MARTNFQLALNGASWIDVNSQFTINNLPDRVPDELSIAVSLYNLFNCPIGGRGKIFEPEYGSEWLLFLQEPIDQQTTTAMVMSMIQCIRRWEPRISLDYGNTFIIPDVSIPGYRVRIAGMVTLTKTPIAVSFIEQI